MKGYNVGKHFVILGMTPAGQSPLGGARIVVNEIDNDPGQARMTKV